MLVGVFVAFFGGLLVLSTLGREPSSSEAKQELLAYEHAVLPAARDIGTGIVLGIRPDITDFREGRITAAVFRNDMVARASQFERAAAIFDRAEVPAGLEAAAEDFRHGFLHYRLAVLALHEAGVVEGPDRERLLTLGASLGNRGDGLYDRAGARVQQRRVALGMGRIEEWPDRADPVEAASTGSVSVERGCGGRQAVHVERARAGGLVVFDTHYADITSGLSRRHVAGLGHGLADTDGRFTAAWAVPADAPPGPAVVAVATEGGVASAPFTLGSC